MPLLGLYDRQNWGFGFINRNVALVRGTFEATFHRGFSINKMIYSEEHLICRAHRASYFRIL
jgi:hypothetical protein